MLFKLKEKNSKIKITKEKERPLYTVMAASIPKTPWTAYPRPQMRRKEWLCLNGEWDFSFCRKKQKVKVPFCAESLLSGISERPDIGETLIYHRSFEIPEKWQGKRVILHFGAVMRSAVVYINKDEVCKHKNGYLSFESDITGYLKEGKNEISVSVINDLDMHYPVGKQSKKRGGMWYTPCSGIWQTVWLEPVPEIHVESMYIQNGTDWVEIEAIGVQKGIVILNECEYPLYNGKTRIEIPDPHLWSPEDPYLYTFVLKSGGDEVSSYFALRTLSIEEVNGIPRLCLNEKPYFFNGLLDQGYWSDGLYTPAVTEAFEQDILEMKSLGFNTLRKHIKIEPEQFYYDCDRLGMIVFQDMVNNGKYRYIRDTVLPTIHFQKRKDKHLNPDPDSRKIFLESMENTVKQLGNHPCICLWTIFNEGWGQFCADDAYRRLKAIDNTRFIDSTSGWFAQKESDVESLHIYFDKLHIGKQKRPQIISEFGGYVWKIPEYSFNLKKTYGYRIFKTREEYVEALKKLYASIQPLIEEGLCGAIYTQVSDVEDETNGILTFDREVQKVHEGELLDLSAILQ